MSVILIVVSLAKFFERFQQFDDVKRLFKGWLIWSLFKHSNLEIAAGTVMLITKNMKKVRNEIKRA